ncbi:MAG: HD domain-containing protein [bacterium]|nr:HD domain-containing protein [bacterium]
MKQEDNIPLYDLVMSVADAVDLVSPVVANHHQQVAHIAYIIGKEIELPASELNDLVIAGALHDIGALSLQQRLDALEFEADRPHRHAELGYHLLKTFKPFSNIAALVRFHHVPWDEGKGREFRGTGVSVGSHIIHLADRIAVLIRKEEEILSQSVRIVTRITEQSGRMFMPKLVTVFQNLAGKEYFWLEAISPSRDSVLWGSVRLNSLILDLDGLVNLAELFAGIIDFRSRHTATHSSSVAAAAEQLARLVGFSGRESRMIKIAGYLHDLGKLSVPAEILEKKTPLSEEESFIMKKHPFYSYMLLGRIEALKEVDSWASFHHERLNGSGYPFHIKEEDISFGARIIAVADVFTALTEDRPYRKGMSEKEVLDILKKMGENRELDPYIVSVMDRNFDQVNSIRVEAQERALVKYGDIGKEIG